MKIWASQLRNSRIFIKFDNMAVVEIIAFGHTRDQILDVCARNIWMLAALYNISM